MRRRRLADIALLSAANAVLFILITAPASSLACRPLADQKYPTLEDNFHRAKSIYFATILKSTPTQKVLRLDLKIEKVFKGAAPSGSFVITNESSSCDRLAYGLAAGDGCVLFEMPDGRLLTSMLEGESSICFPKGTPKLKTVATEFEAKFRFGKSQTKP